MKIAQLKRSLRSRGAKGGWSSGAREKRAIRQLPNGLWGQVGRARVATAAGGEHGDEAKVVAGNKTRAVGIRGDRRSDRDADSRSQCSSPSQRQRSEAAGLQSSRVVRARVGPASSESTCLSPRCSLAAHGFDQIFLQASCV